MCTRVKTGEICTKEKGRKKKGKKKGWKKSATRRARTGTSPMRPIKITNSEHVTSCIVFTTVATGICTVRVGEERTAWGVNGDAPCMQQRFKQQEDTQDK
jgi:hypothetical protein